MANLRELSKRLARLEDERRTTKGMDSVVRAKLQEIKAGIPDREQHMAAREEAHGR